MKQIRLKWLLLSFISIAFIGCTTYYFKDDLNSILGVENVEIESKTIYDEFGGLHGEKIVLEEYKLSDKTISEFTNNIASQKEFKYKDKEIKWQQVPIVTNYQTALSRIIDYKTTDSELYIKIEQIKALIQMPNTYYSLVFDEEDDDYVQLFVMDFKTKTLFTIDQQM
ncbi:MAG: hypothetical protein PHX48_05925 [Bacteroidales bacterium]|nr:hypothetical protein [Bacteroidales bacterium]